MCYCLFPSSYINWRHTIKHLKVMETQKFLSPLLPKNNINFDFSRLNINKKLNTNTQYSTQIC